MPNMTQALGSVEIAGRIYTSSQVQLALYILVGLIALILLGLVISVIRKKGGGNNKKRKTKSEPPAPQYEEIFEIESEIFETNPYKSDPDTHFEEPILRTVTLTLMIGLREYLAKLAENPSDQHKSMSAIATQLEARGVTPIAYTQWNQSSIQGVAARIILSGKSRTALFGPSVAMAKASAKFPDEISLAIESAHAAGHSVFVLAIDGLAYGVFSVSHRLQLIAATS